MYLKMTKAWSFWKLKMQLAGIVLSRPISVDVYMQDLWAQAARQKTCQTRTAPATSLAIKDSDLLDTHLQAYPHYKILHRISPTKVHSRATAVAQQDIQQLVNHHIPISRASSQGRRRDLQVTLVGRRRHHTNLDRHNHLIFKVGAAPLIRAKVKLALSIRVQCSNLSLPKCSRSQDLTKAIHHRTILHLHMVTTSLDTQVRHSTKQEAQLRTRAITVQRVAIRTRVTLQGMDHQCRPVES